MSSDESKPSKKHKNNSSSAPPSCVQCKRNHKKCDKLEPKCSYCTSRNLECVYEEPKKRGRASELYQVNLKKKKECDGNLVDEYFDIICIGHPVIKKGVLEYFLNNYLHKIENNSSKRKISLEENEFITSLEDLNCIYVFYLSIKAVHHQLKSELEMADQFAKSAEIEVGKLFVDHAQNYYLYCACQQLSAFYNGRGDILKRKIYLSMVENYVSECLQDTSDIITKNLERRTVFLSKSMDELFSALPEFIEHFPRIVESSVDQKLDQLLLPGTLEYMKKAPITSENCMLFKQVIDFVFKVVVSLKSELFKQFEDCRTARFTEFMQLHIIFTYNSTSLSFYRNIPELRNLVEEMALKITMSTEHEVFKYIYSDAGIVLMLVSEIHIEICKLIESGLRQNNLPLITNNGKSITVDYFQILDKKIKDQHKRNLYETLTNYGLIIVAILIMALSSALMPFGSSLWSLCAIFFLWGIGQGYLGIIAQALLFSIWNEMKINVTPFSQLFHFSAGLGLFFGPFTVLVVNSILGIDNSQVVVPADEVSESLSSILQNNVTLSNSTIIGNSTGTPAGFIEGTLISKSVLGTNFIICLLYLLSISLFIVYMVYMWMKRNNVTEDVKPINDAEEDDTASVGSIEHGDVKKSTTATSSKSEFLVKLFVTILVALALLTYCMAESTYGNVIYSYLTAMELADDSEANMINSGYWLLFTIGRGIAIPISYFIPPFIMLLIDFIGVGISIALFWIFSTNISALWVSSLLFGLSIASLYPTTISIPSSVMNLEITGLMTSLMVLGGSGGAMTGPYITLALFKKISPKVIFATVTITEVCLAIVLISLFIFSRIYNRRRNMKKEASQTIEKQDVSPVHSPVE